MKKVLLFISMLLAAVLITSLYSCTQDGGENDSRHQRGNDVNLNLKKACESLQKVDDIYMECSSIEDLQERAEEISQIEEVQDVYFSDIAMFVKVKDFMTVSFCFYPEQDPPKMEDMEFIDTRQVRTRANIDRTNSSLGFEKAVIIDQQIKDRQWGEYKDKIVDFLDKVGIETTINNEPTLNFYEEGIYENDIVLIVSHGHYDKKRKLHWLDINYLEVFDEEEYEEKPFIWGDIYNLFSDDKYYNYYKGYIEDEQLTINRSTIKVNGKKTEYACFSISEKFITAQQKNFKKPGKALVFSVACQSLKEGDNSKQDNNGRNFDFAKAFIQRKAGVYFGYDESNGAGQWGGLYLLGRIASGQSVLSAYNSLPNWVLHDYRNNKKPPYTADLLFYPEDHFEIEDCCQVFPTLTKQGETDTDYILNATEPYYLIDFDYDDSDKKWVYEWTDYKDYKFKYGFEVSISKDFDPSETKDYIALEVNDNTNFPNHVVSYSKNVPKSDLQSETTYYYRAYFNDGTNKYYSDYDEFTTPKQERIEQVIPKEILETMEPYITIYEGDSPPVVEGVYVISPNVISYDSTNGFDAGELFADHYLKFSNQDILKNTLDFEGKEVVDGRTISYEGGPGAFISGTGDNFTVFFDVSGTAYFDEYNVDYTEALVISGTLTSTGIKNAEYSFVLTWKGDDPKPYAIKKGDFRVFKDNDGLASKATWPSGARRWGWDYKVKDGKITTPWSIYAVRK